MSKTTARWPYPTSDALLFGHSKPLSTKYNEAIASVSLNSSIFISSDEALDKRVGNLLGPQIETCWAPLCVKCSNVTIRVRNGKEE